MKIYNPTPRVIVVEYDIKHADKIITSLEKNGYLVKWLTDTHGLENAIQLFRPEVIIIDMNAAVGECLNIISSIRLNVHMHQTRIIVLADQFVDSEAVRLLTAGADDYLDKPISQDELLARIWSHLRLSRIGYVANEKSVFPELVVSNDKNPLPQRMYG